MKKTITKDIIVTELTKIYLHNVIKYFLLLILCLAYLVFYFIYPESNIYNPVSIVLLLSPLYTVLIILSVINLYKTFKAYLLTKNNKIDIITDVLVKKSKKSHLSRYRGFHHTYTFIFEKSGVYNVKKHILAISNPYDIDNEQLYNISRLDDNFYIVSVGAWKNILAYNHKLFEYKDVLN